MSPSLLMMDRTSKTKNSTLNAANLRKLCNDDIVPPKSNSKRKNPGGDPIKPDVFRHEQDKDDMYKNFAATIEIRSS